jgi:hypothetical protein
MEIKQNILNPFGSREEMGGGTSAWTYGRGVIGSPAAEPQPDLTLRVNLQINSLIGWSFSALGDHVPPISSGDRVVVSGFYVVDENGNRTPDGSINVNGEWIIDQIVETNNAGLLSTQFSSAALRSEIGDATFSTAVFDFGTALIYNQ